MAKRTYSLPSATIARLEREVDPGARSRAVADAISSWLAARERERLRGEIVTGCREMAAVYRATSAEFAVIEDDAERHVAD